jgi:large subunit ribosomal protein L25
MKVSVPVRVIGIPVGVKNDGGILDQVMREVEIECLPGEIPSHIDVDVSGLAIYQAVRVSDLPHSGSIKFLSAEDATVAHVISIRAEVEPVAADAAAPAVAEPEVAKKGKTDAPAAEPKK